MAGLTTSIAPSGLAFYTAQATSLLDSPSEFFFPSGIAVAANGNVYVSDSNNRRIQVFTPKGTLVLADAPCSGSGSWRRDPQGKWALSEQRLAELVQIQAGILDKTAPMLAANGVLAYATCSMLTEENEAQIQGFLARNSQFSCSFMRRFSPLEGADGFFVALLARQGG